MEWHLMIEEIMFKGSPCIKIENKDLRIIIIPSLGGKIASIYRKDKDFELLYQNQEDKYRRPQMYDDFSKYDASGFDDAFPSIDASIVKHQDNVVLYPDHGEIWSAEFQARVRKKKLELFYESKEFNYSYEKNFSIQGGSLTIHYKIFNKGINDFPCIWAMHCLVKCEENMELLLPKATKKIINVLNSNSLGAVGRILDYPETLGEDGQTFNLNQVRSKDSETMEKYYVKGKVAKGMCGAYYPSKDVNYRIYYKKRKLPYLGVWINEGGYRGDYNCALEPTNGYYDSIDTAEKEKCLYILKPNKSLKFSIRLELK